MKTAEIRRRFQAYFEAHDHRALPSASLVPAGDSTLLFTNAGMVPFKDYFLGVEKPPHPRAVTCQRCVRAGGKHNDLDNVGYTARHHTFFEMLGNFSFGDYFKETAIEHAWRLLTEDFGLPEERLWVSVYEQDDEAADLWRTNIGLPPDRILRLGRKDNFWQMGDTGPCGPCSEIYYDHGPEVEGGLPGTPEEGDRYIEIWNLVFMQFNREADGTETPLPRPSVDTGMGIERIAAVLQGVQSNYDIDLFRNLIAAAAKAVGTKDLNAQSLRVIADHLRSTAFIIADGVTPDNEGRGYVLRRIIRRAVRHGYQLGCREAFLPELVPALVAEMGEAYPELAEAAPRIEETLKRESDRFGETLSNGLQLLQGELEKVSDGVLPGEVAFRLYDTYGFPADLTADIAREHDLTVDLAGFDQAMAAQQKRAREAQRFNTGLPVTGLAPSEFVGYDDLTGESDITALFADDAPCETLKAGQRGVVVLARTPFYAESGGQVGDHGRLIVEGGEFRVEDTRYLGNRVIGHFGQLQGAKIKVGQPCRAEVDAERRRDCVAHHSATHLLHAALKNILGDSVQQKGSLVEASRLRFDFSHPEPLSDGQMQEVSAWVNRVIRENHAARVKVMPLEKAKAAGAEALFGEKYSDQARTVKFGPASFELCGGTHVGRTGDLGAFVLTGQSAVAAGVRRVEALAGAAAERHIAGQQACLQQLGAQLNANPDELGDKIERLLGERRELKKKIAEGSDDSGTSEVREVAGVKLACLQLGPAEAPALRKRVDDWKRQLGSGLVLIVSLSDEKVLVMAGATDDLVKRFPASELIDALMPMIEGRGGGRASLAQGSGRAVAGAAGLADAACDWLAKRAD